MIDDPSRARLLTLAEKNGASLSALSRMIGRNASYLQQFIRKGSPRKLEESDRRRLADFFGIGEDELGGAPEENSYVPPAPPSRGGPQWLDIPRLPLGASAGPGAFAAEEIADGHLRFSARFLRDLGLSHGALTAITVAGDSMVPTLADGDEILVSRETSRLRDGIHVIRRDDALQVKRLQFASPGRVSILSDNQAYPSDQDVPLPQIEVLGRVVWKGGRV